MPGYRQEALVSAASRTETFVSLKLFVDNWRWAGVPFYIRTGKRLARRVTEIVVQFKRAPFVLFRKTAVDKLEPNRLVLHLQPEEGISLSFGAKIPGRSCSLAPSTWHSTTPITSTRHRRPATSGCCTTVCSAIPRYSSGRTWSKPPGALSRRFKMCGVPSSLGTFQTIRLARGDRRRPQISSARMAANGTRRRRRGRRRTLEQLRRESLSNRRWSYVRILNARAQYART